MFLNNVEFSLPEYTHLYLAKNQLSIEADLSVIERILMCCFGDYE
jgi:hypothetical protein